MPHNERADHISGDLRRLIAMIGVAIAFFGVLLLAIIAYAGWSANETATERERTLVENALNQSIARALNEQKSVAWWDDSVQKITDQAIDLDFTDANFGIFLTETYGHDEVYILNAADKPLYAFFGGKREDPPTFERRRPAIAGVIAEARSGKPSSLHPRPDMFSASQSNYRILAGATHVARWAGHIVSIDGRPAVVAALTIVPNVDMELLKGTPNLLVSITYIDDGFISEIGRTLLLPDLRLTPEVAKGDGIVSEAFVGDDGIPAGFLTWTTRRPGEVLLTIILPLVAFGVLATGLLSRTMFRRLNRASTALARSESQARHEAKHDALSGLPNRVHMVERIEAFLHSPVAKRAGQPAVAAYIDIDRFKDINDTLGHEAGDQLIAAVAQRLVGRLRPQDFLSRFGGDEFAILCAPAGHEAAAILARRIAQAFESPFSVKGQNIRVTASVGLAIAPENGTTADELMRHADIALYEAKNQGRDRAVMFCAEMAEQVEHRRSIELALRHALEDDALDLHYQPIISCQTGAVVGVEALLRWEHPVYGEMSPADFIPIAENAGLLPSLGEWVLDCAMTDAKKWPKLEVAVNLSPVQIRHVDLEGTLRKLVAEHDIDPRRFTLEITENVLLEATDRVNAILDVIRGMGFKTALDDFGTGYSSLSYLCTFRFDKIKIDRSFVARISEIDTSRTIIKSVVSLGRGLGMSIIAEGVETEFEADTMTQFGCTELQGFYFSPPISAEGMVEFLRTYRPRRPASVPPSLRAAI
ncbi:MAG: putative bifunctional diguanylate cyclase/phosphodiesterase, partial [Methyloceanibacter sp.]